ncbi:hypothetical protein BSK48_16130 [Paenibacillus odorifer]|uniref:helix-turn-helix transcriptional regulator n=1 Tax=Paenibacillus odorifer TaxID=189426 RepID=UPI00096F88FB|nr:AraC family transcriptional regulator [Paenibacillus odorifer]OMD70154.1 hypothetical protein BSK48_16130 [Paenibacillus odorifer]
MEKLNEITDAYALRKGNDSLSYLLSCIRKGNSSQIETELNDPEYLQFTEMIFRHEYSFAYMIIQFLWPQIVRAAVEGGMPEMAASGLYRSYIDKARRSKSVRVLLEMHKQIFLEYSYKVAQSAVDSYYSPLVRKCRSFVRGNLYGRLSIGEIARELHCSRSHLAHVYKSETGETLTARIRLEKIFEAKLLLEHSSFPLSNIAQKLGYSSQSHLADTFRKVTGMTPGQFRNQAEVES